jgi:hypothetical protein
MKRKTILILIALAVLCVALSVGNTTTSAQSSGGYDLSWYTVDGGGATFSTGGSYSLGGSIGQPEAVGQVANLPYTLNSGFWGGVSINYDIYLPLVVK